MEVAKYSDPVVGPLRRDGQFLHCGSGLQNKAWAMVPNQCDATTSASFTVAMCPHALSLELVWHHILLPCCISSFLCSLASFSSFYCTFNDFSGLQGSAGKGVLSWLRRSTAFRDCNQRWELKLLYFLFPAFLLYLSTSFSDFLLFHPTIDLKYLNILLFFFYSTFSSLYIEKKTLLVTFLFKRHTLCMQLAYC